MCPEDASSAAPGVDQAIAIGSRVRRPSTIAVSPIATHSASRPEAAWRSSAPTARSPARTTANELVSPTAAATTPASTAWRSARGPAAGGDAVVGAL